MLSRQKIIGIGLCLLFFGVAASPAFAQADDEIQPEETVQGHQDANWIVALGLTPDQIAKIRGIRQQNSYEWQAARRRLNQAQRALDQAIYSDEASETEVEDRAREVAAAQADEVRLRARTELSIRRVLTPQQLSAFRIIRRQRIRQAQIRRRGGTPDMQRGLRNRRLQNGISPTAPPLPAPRRGQGGMRRIQP